MTVDLSRRQLFGVGAALVLPPLVLGNWNRTFIEDFLVPAHGEDFLSVYGSKWTAYKTGTPTTGPWHSGIYDNSIIDVADGILSLDVHTGSDGRPRTAALLPKLGNGTSRGVKNGRFMIRFRVPQPLPGFKLAWLLWPDSGVWPRDGEIDFPECGLSAGSTIHGFVHKQNATEGRDQYSANSSVHPADGNWHVATINYKSGGWRTPMVDFVIDGTRIGSWRDHRIPTGPMHWVIQTEPNLSNTKPNPVVRGKVQIDWVARYNAA